MNWIAEKLAEHLKENPDHAFLYDESNAKGLTYRQFDELSGKVRAFLLDNRIGKEDFVLINLPRGSQPLIAAMGVWRTGAAFALVEEAGNQCKKLGNGHEYPARRRICRSR